MTTLIWLLPRSFWRSCVTSQVLLLARPNSSGGGGLKHLLAFSFVFSPSGENERLAFNENRHRRLSSCTPHKFESVVFAGRTSAEPRLPVRPPGSRNPGPQELPASRRSSVAARDTSCCISQYVGWPLQSQTCEWLRKKMISGDGASRFRTRACIACFPSLRSQRFPSSGPARRTNKYNGEVRYSGGVTYSCVPKPSCLPPFRPQLPTSTRRLLAHSRVIS